MAGVPAALQLGSVGPRSGQITQIRSIPATVYLGVQSVTVVWLRLSLTAYSPCLRRSDGRDEGGNAL